MGTLLVVPQGQITRFDLRSWFVLKGKLISNNGLAGFASVEVDFPF